MRGAAVESSTQINYVAGSALRVEHHAGVELDRLFHWTIECQLASIEHEAAVAQIRDGCHIVRYEEHGASLPADFVHFAQAFSLKGDIAHRQHFISDENFSIQVGGYGERQSQIHSAGVALYWKV